MANIASQASGNWSNPATWSGGVLPGVNDVAQALTGHTVTIDQNVAVQSLSNTGSGKFVLTGSTARTVTCSVSLILALTATSSLIELDASYSATGSVINAGLIAAGAITGTAAAFVSLLSGATGTLSMTGTNWTGDSSATGVATSLVLNASDVDVTINVSGTITNTQTTSGIYNTSSGDLTVTALAFHATNSVPNPGGVVAVIGTLANTISVTASLVKQSGQSGVLVYIDNANSDVILTGDASPTTNSNGGSIVIMIIRAKSVVFNGNLLGGQNPSTYAMQIASTATGCTVVVNGNVTGGIGNSSQSGGPAIDMQNGQLLTINGDVRSGPSLNYESATGIGGTAISRSTATTVWIKGNIYVDNMATRPVLDWAFTANTGALRVGASGVTSYINENSKTRFYYGPIQIVDGATIIYRYGTFSPDGTFIPDGDNLTNADSNLSPADVRDGVVYDSDNKTGTMAIPDEDDVLLGVPVDTTFGTKSVKLADAAAITGSQIEVIGA